MVAERTTTSSGTTSSSNNNLSTAARAMVQQDQHAAALKCPRCDSSNTKFCYYNNYSLSQPRHFCKACKRYWTRGGTLRNVPVGGGCRKNKRVKKPSTAAATSSDPSPLPPISQPSLVPPLSLPSSNPSDLNSLFYGGNNMNLGNFPAYDLHPQLNNSIGSLAFPSNSNQHDDIGSHLADLQQSVTFLHEYPHFGSHLSSATAASLLVSSLKQPKKVDQDYLSSLPYEDLQASANGNLKVEPEYNVMSNRLDWQVPCENQFEGFNSAGAAADYSYLYWNTSNVGGPGWSDATNCGSSVAPLI